MKMFLRFLFGFAEDVVLGLYDRLIGYNFDEEIARINEDLRKQAEGL